MRCINVFEVFGGGTISADYIICGAQCKVKMWVVGHSRQLPANVVLLLPLEEHSSGHLHGWGEEGRLGHREQGAGH